MCDDKMSFGQMIFERNTWNLFFPGNTINRFGTDLDGGSLAFVDINGLVHVGVSHNLSKNKHFRQSLTLKYLK